MEILTWNKSQKSCFSSTPLPSLSYLFSPLLSSHQDFSSFSIHSPGILHPNNCNIKKIKKTYRQEEEGWKAKATRKRTPQPSSLSLPWWWMRGSCALPLPPFVHDWRDKRIFGIFPPWFFFLSRSALVNPWHLPSLLSIASSPSKSLFFVQSNVAPLPLGAFTPSKLRKR